MDVPVVLGNGINAEEPVLTALLVHSRTAAAQAVPVDAAADHHVRHVDAAGPVFARHALRDQAKAGLGGGEVREARLAADAGRGAGEDDGAAAERHQAAGRLAPDQEAAEAADA